MVNISLHSYTDDLRKSEGLWEALFNHTSTFDFKLNYAGDTFEIQGRFGNYTLGPDDFGNFMAGYGGVYADGDFGFGYWGVVVGGIEFDAADSLWGDGNTFDWDADSSDDINFGASFARNELHPSLPSFDINSPVNNVARAVSP